MSDNFEKLDEWMMEVTRAAREKKVPEKDRQGFQESVMRKIAERQIVSPGIPYFGVSVMAAICVLAVLGVIWMSRPATAPAPKTEVKPFVQAQPAAPMTSAPVIISQEAKPAAVSKKPMTEQEILNDIEALRELDSWTEQDEEEAGIPVEVTFSDLDTGINSQPITSPVTASNG